VTEKKRGPKPRLDAKRKHLAFRLHDATYDLLLTAAANAGRSISEEIEFRLQQSFDHPTLIDALADRLEARLTEAERACHLELLQMHSDTVQ
jgi:uncharacterized protein (DUF1778 family)